MLFSCIFPYFSFVSHTNHRSLDDLTYDSCIQRRSDDLAFIFLFFAFYDLLFWNTYELHLRTVNHLTSFNALVSAYIPTVEVQNQNWLISFAVKLILQISSWKIVRDTEISWSSENIPELVTASIFQKSVNFKRNLMPSLEGILVLTLFRNLTLAINNQCYEPFLKTISCPTWLCFSAPHFLSVRKWGKWESCCSQYLQFIS